MTTTKKATLFIAGLIICLAMIRLGYWQLGRAEEKQQTLEQVQQREQMASVDVRELVEPDGDFKADDHLYRRVSATGVYHADKTIFIDNQVQDSQVGYRLVTPLKLSDSKNYILVDRGWISVGESRASLPQFATAAGEVVLSGRLQRPAAKPPLWDEDYAVNSGHLWQYLPIADYARQMQLNFLPLVLELAPEEGSEIEPSLRRQWAKIDDQWVAKHRGYAFQWFAMSAAFFVACLVLLLRSRRRQSSSSGTG